MQYIVIRNRNNVNTDMENNKIVMPKELVPVYNDFVDTCNENDLNFESINVSVGETKAGRKGLSFEMMLPFGLEQKKANEIFGVFIKKHPDCHISFNEPEHSALEKMLRSKSQTVIGVTNGFKLKKM